MDWPPDSELVLPDVDSLRYLSRLRKHQPDLYDEATAALDVPLDDHRRDCPCWPHRRARLDLAMPDEIEPSPDTADQARPEPRPHEETPMQQTHPPGSTVNQADMVPCAACGIAVPGIGLARNGEPIMPPLQRCPTCKAIKDLGRTDPDGSAVALLADLTGLKDLDVNPIMLDVAQAVPVACRQPGMVTPSLRTGTNASEPLGQPIPGQALPGMGQSKRWGHVDGATRRDLKRRANAARGRQPGPGPSPSGKPCAFCGRNQSPLWYRDTVLIDNHPRGDRLALCGTCGERIWFKVGESIHDPGLTSFVTAVALDLPRPLMGIAVIKPYLDHAQPPYEGSPEPWGYLDPEDLAAAREWVYTRRPKLAPPEWLEKRARIDAATAAVEAGKPPPKPKYVNVPGRRA